jgi:large subunit ribosomal protein L20
MPRVKTGKTTNARHKKVLKQAKGYFGSKHRLYRTAKEQVMHSLDYAYRDRRQKKRDFRKLWITRINEACRQHDMSYSKFINGLTKAEIAVNRKMLSEIAISNPEAFKNLVDISKAALEGKTLDLKLDIKKTDKKETKKPAKKEAVKATEKKETKKEEKTDISSMKVAELKELAKSKNIEGYSKMKKAELIDALK